MPYKPFNARQHCEIDYGFVAYHVIVPRLLGLSSRAKAVALGLGTFTGLVTALTKQPYAVEPVIPLRVHGKLETPFLPALIAIPAIAGVMKEPKARAYFLTFFGIACANYLLTDYNADEPLSNLKAHDKKQEVAAGALERNPHHQLTA